MKSRNDSFFGLHFDYHGKPLNGIQGNTLKEEDIRRICREIKPDFIQIDCKGHPGWASYPSKIGNALPEFAQDTLALWRKVTEEEDVALYLHYSGVYDIKYCSEHPEDTSMAPDGSLVPGATRPNGKYVDDLLIPQLSEIVEKYGVNGFWIDGECWKVSTDFRPETVKAFEAETGIDLGGRLPANKDDPYYEEYREYGRELFRRYVRHYVDTLHAKFPDLQIASNWAFSDHMPEEVSANVDFLSGDLNPENSLQSARYAARALAQQDMPWDLMSWNFRWNVGGVSCCVPKHPNQILQEAASVISLGGAYQNYIMQFKNGEPNMYEIENMTALRDFMRARQDFCFRGKPVHEAALLLSTCDRLRESDGLYSRNGYEKTFGLTALLCDIGQPLEIISEHTLKKQVNEYKMIVIPELYYGLDKDVIEILLDYAKNGGNLVLCGKNTCRIFSEAGAPYTVSELPELFEAGIIAYDNGFVDDKPHVKVYHFTVGENKLNYGSLFKPASIVLNGKVIAEVADDIRKNGTPLAATVEYGKGSVSAVGFDIGTQYLSAPQYTYRSLFKTLADSLYTPIVKIEGICGSLEIVPLLKDGRLMIQLVNGGGSHADTRSATDDRIAPALDIELSVALKDEPDALVLQPEGRKLDFEWRHGRAYVRIDRIDIHSVIEVVTK